MKRQESARNCVQLPALLRRKWWGLGVIAVVALVGSIALAGPAGEDTCGADGAVLGDHDNDPGTDLTWKLNCSGGCESSSDCKERSGSDAQGAFKFCGCGSSKKYWPGRCCSLVLRDLEQADKFEPAKWGSCPPCPSTGACVVVAVGGEAQAACWQEQ